jgi:hypothetical protein
VFYRWQKEFFENGAAAFQQRGRTNDQPQQERIAYLEKKVQTKDEVLAELMAEHVALKKRVGEPTCVAAGNPNPPCDTSTMPVTGVMIVNTGELYAWLKTAPYFDPLSEIPSGIRRSASPKV